MILSLLALESVEDSPFIDKVSAWVDGLLAKSIAALKKAESVSLESKLMKLLKLMKWMEGRLSERVIFPRMIQVETATLGPPQRQSLP
jgi:hypothetical protein